MDHARQRLSKLLNKERSIRLSDSNEDEEQHHQIPIPLTPTVSRRVNDTTNFEDSKFQRNVEDSVVGSTSFVTSPSENIDLAKKRLSRLFNENNNSRSSLRGAISSSLSPLRPRKRTPIKCVHYPDDIDIEKKKHDSKKSIDLSISSSLLARPVVTTKSTNQTFVAKYEKTLYETEEKEVENDIKSTSLAKFQKDSSRINDDQRNKPSVRNSKIPFKETDKLKSSIKSSRIKNIETDKVNASRGRLDKAMDSRPPVGSLNYFVSKLSDIQNDIQKSATKKKRMANMNSMKTLEMQLNEMSDDSFDRDQSIQNQYEQSITSLARSTTNHIKPKTIDFRLIPMNPIETVNTNTTLKSSESEINNTRRLATWKPNLPETEVSRRIQSSIQSNYVKQPSKAMAVDNYRRDDPEVLEAESNLQRISMDRNFDGKTSGTYGNSWLNSLPDGLVPPNLSDYLYEELNDEEENIPMVVESADESTYSPDYRRQSFEWQSNQGKPTMNDNHMKQLYLNVPNNNNSPITTMEQSSQTEEKQIVQHQNRGETLIRSRSDKSNEVQQERLPSLIATNTIETNQTPAVDLNSLFQTFLFNQSKQMTPNESQDLVSSSPKSNNTKDEIIHHSKEKERDNPTKAPTTAEVGVNTEQDYLNNLLEDDMNMIRDIEYHITRASHSIDISSTETSAYNLFSEATNYLQYLGLESTQLWLSDSNGNLVTPSLQHLNRMIKIDSWQVDVLLHFTRESIANHSKENNQLAHGLNIFSYFSETETHQISGKQEYQHNHEGFNEFSKVMQLKNQDSNLKSGEAWDAIHVLTLFNCDTSYDADYLSSHSIQASTLIGIVIVGERMKNNSDQILQSMNELNHTSKVRLSSGILSEYLMDRKLMLGRLLNSQLALPFSYLSSENHTPSRIRRFIGLQLLQYLCHAMSRRVLFIRFSTAMEEELEFKSNEMNAFHVKQDTLIEELQVEAADKCNALQQIYEDEKFHLLRTIDELRNEKERLNEQYHREKLEWASAVGEEKSKLLTQFQIERSHTIQELKKEKEILLSTHSIEKKEMLAKLDEEKNLLIRQRIEEKHDSQQRLAALKVEHLTVLEDFENKIKDAESRFTSEKIQLVKDYEEKLETLEKMNAHERITVGQLIEKENFDVDLRHQQDIDTIFQRHIEEQNQLNKFHDKMINDLKSHHQAVLDNTEGKYERKLMEVNHQLQLNYESNGLRSFDEKLRKTSYEILAHASTQLLSPDITINYVITLLNQSCCALWHGLSSTDEDSAMNLLSYDAPDRLFSWIFAQDSQQNVVKLNNIHQQIHAPDEYQLNRVTKMYQSKSPVIMKERQELHSLHSRQKIKLKSSDLDFELENVNQNSKDNDLQFSEMKSNVFIEALFANRSTEHQSNQSKFHMNVLIEKVSNLHLHASDLFEQHDLKELQTSHLLHADSSEDIVFISYTFELIGTTQISPILEFNSETLKLCLVLGIPAIAHTDDNVSNQFFQTITDSLKNIGIAHVQALGTLLQSSINVLDERKKFDLPTVFKM